MATIGTLVAYLNIDATGLKKAEKQAEKSFGKIEKVAKDAATSMAGLYGGLQAIQIVKDVIKIADTMKLLDGRLKLVTDSQKEFTEAQDELFRIANDTRNALEGTVSLYTRMARAAESTGKSQEEMLQVTESINKALTVSGAEASSAQAALIQLSQGLAANALRGEEMNSILEQTPRVAQLIADGLGKTTAQLRDMGKAGELTADKVITAILSQKQAIDREFSVMPKTVGQAITVMTNHIQKFIAEFDKATGSSAAIAAGIDKITAAIKGIDSSEISKMATAMAAIGSTAERTIKVVAAYYALFAGPGVVAAFGMWIKSQYAAASAALQLQTQVAAGNAVMLGSAQATAMKAAADAESAAMTVKNAQAQVARTQTDIAAIQAKIALINVEKNQIMTLIQEGRVTANVTLLEQRFAVATKAAAAAQLELRNITAANTQAQAALATATTRATAATEASAIATKAAASSVLTLGNAVNALFAGIIGWQIGKWLTDNFEWARIAGIHFVDDTIKGWYELERAVKLVIAAISSTWTDSINTLRTTYADFLDFAAKGVGVLDKTAAAGMQKTIEELRKSVDKELSFEEAKIKINLEFDEKTAERGRRIAEMLAVASGRVAKAEKEKNEVKEKAKAKTEELTSAEKKYLSAQQSLIDSLLPLQTLQREYQVDLAMLNDWYSKNSSETVAYQKALARLNKEYAESKKAITASDIAEITAEIRKQAEQEKLLQEAVFNRFEIEKNAIDLKEKAGKITTEGATAERIALLQEELAERQRIHDSIIENSAEATIARQEELLAIQQINAAILDQQAIVSDNTWLAGAKSAWAEYSSAALDAGAQAKNFFSTTFQSLEDTVMDFVNTGTFAFEEFAKSVLADLTRIYVRAILVRSVMGFMGGGGGGMLHDGLAAGDTPKFHNGMSPAYQPPKLHNGLKPDEFPAILQVGERVTSKKEVQSQNQQLADYERFKNGGGGEQGGGMSVSVPITMDPSYSKKFRSDMQRSVEDTVLKVVKRFS
jgi:lambda family phage tail tape measure protein